MKEFDAQINQGWGYTFVPNGKYPVIGNRIFSTYDGAAAFLNHSTAIPGLILRVIEDEVANKNAAYIIKKDTEAESGLKLVKLAEGDLDISGSMVTIVEATDGKLYDKNDCTGSEEEGWTPVEGAVPSPAEVTEPGKYLKLELGEDEVYINSKDLIDLTDYYTKEEVNGKIADVSAYIGEEIEKVEKEIVDLSTDLTEYIDSEIDAEAAERAAKDTEIDSSIKNISTLVDEINSQLSDFIDIAVDKFTEIDSSIDRLDTSVNAIESKLEDGVVSSVTSGDNAQSDYLSLSKNVKATGDVEIELSAKVVDASEAEFQNVQNNGLATVGYVKEQLAVYNWVIVEEPETPEQSGTATEPVYEGTSEAPVQVNMDIADDATVLTVESALSEVTVNGQE